MNIQEAKVIIAALAEGKNPFSGMPLPADSICHNVEVVRAMYALLGAKVPKPKREKKRGFYISEEQKKQFEFSSKPICATQFVDQCNALADLEHCQKLTYRIVTQWLLEINALEQVEKKKRPTVQGEGLGIFTEDRKGQHGIYTVITYDTEAQQFLLDNLEAMVEFDDAKKRAERTMQGKPWSAEQEAQLRDLFDQNYSVRDIAKEMKRNTGGIRARMKKLNLIKE